MRAELTRRITPTMMKTLQKIKLEYFTITPLVYLNVCNSNNNTCSYPTILQRLQKEKQMPARIYFCATPIDQLSIISYVNLCCPLRP